MSILDDVITEDYDPLLIVSKDECRLAEKINLSDNDKIILPYYLHPVGKKNISLPSGSAEVMYILDKLERDGIHYLTRKIGLADYIAKNKYTDTKVAVKRMSMQTILEMWTKRNNKSYYYGRRGFDAMMRDLRNSLANDIQIILAIEDYYATFFDNGNNTIWTSWKIKYSSKKKDSRGRPLYAMANFKRHAIHPRLFYNTLNDIHRKYQIHVKYFYDGIDLYNYIVDELIFKREYDEEMFEYSYDGDRRVDLLISFMPFLDRNGAERLLEKFGSVESVIKNVFNGDNSEVFGDIPISYEEFERWRNLIQSDGR